MVIIFMKENACLKKVFICRFLLFIFVTGTLMGILKYQSRGKGDPNLELEESVFFNDVGNH